MRAKTSMRLETQILILTVLLFICWSVGGWIAGLGDTAQGGGSTSTMLIMLIICLLHVVVLSYPILRTRWSGWRLMLGVFFIYYSLLTVLSQVETLVFLNYFTHIVPGEMVPKFFLQGLVTAALYAPTAVLVLGKMKGAAEDKEPSQRLVMPWVEWVWKVILVAVVYVLIYMVFGRLVFMPLAGEAFRAYYTDLPPTGLVLPLQLMRGMYWIAVALPVIRMMKGAWWEAGLAVALLYAVIMSSTLLIPNEYMPGEIRRGHFVEILLSNFLFGWIVVWAFHRRHGSPLNLFRLSASY